MAFSWSRLAGGLVPHLITLSTEILQRARSSPRGSARDADSRLAALEDTVRREAELSSEMAQQIRALTEGLVTMRRAAFTSVVLGLAGAGLGLAALIVALR